MPFMDIPNAAYGPVKTRYFISTPESEDSETIDPSLPTILLLHGVYFGQELFSFQFMDPKLRRFNLVTLDFRGHGEAEGSIPSSWGPDMAAEDLVLFMDALKLPACHIFAVSLGTMIALRLAISHPEKVKSLFLLAPLGLEELPEAAEGREELYQIWAEFFTQRSENNIDQETAEFALLGGMQASFKDWQCNIVDALVKICVGQLTRRWRVDNLDQYRNCSCDILTQRKAFSKDALARIRLPVKLAHCMDDVAYPLEYSQKFLEVLQDAKVNASLEKVPEASHFGNYEQADRVNVLLNDFIESLIDCELPPDVEHANSPWDDELREGGWYGPDGDDSSEEFF